MRWAVHVAYMGKMRNACNIFVWKPEGRHKHRWMDSIKIYLKEIV
jgi:hypothetical protein